MDYKSRQVFSSLNFCSSEILMDGFYRTSFLVLDENLLHNDSHKCRIITQIMFSPPYY